MKLPKYYKDPKYRIGDTIVFKELNKEDNVMEIYCERVVRIYGNVELSDPEDKVMWFYHTTETHKDGYETIAEDDIIKKL